MFKMVQWSSDLDLTAFYSEAARRGFINNSSQKAMVDSFKREREWNVWLLYYNNEAIGSVAAHSFDEVMGPNSYRIAARTCVFTDKIPGCYGRALRTKSVIIQHQNPTAQFLIPTCFEWVPKGSRTFITTNQNEAGSQRLVHRIFGPALEQTGQMKKIKDVFYRNTYQTVWEIYPDKYYKVMKQYPKW